MREPLQPFSWKRSSYERPNDKWVCGKRCDGEPCRLGPTVQGRCSQSTDEEPCQPVRSLRYRRRLFTFFAAGLSLSICLVFLGTKPSPVMSAGAISSAHSGHDVSCDRCHAATSDDWATSAFDLEVTSKNSTLCLDCHADLGPQPRNMHGLSGEHLAALTSMSSEPTTTSHPVLLALASQLVNSDSDSTLECNACHFEHRGFDHDLTTIADDRCQTCHKNQFVTFEQGHPDFDGYPYTQPAHIAFDHATHLNRYFQDDAKRLMPDATSPQDCRACHVNADDGTAMLTRSYEQMCATCHEREIEDREFPGVPLLALSRVDPDGNPVTWSTLSADPPLLESPGLLTLLLEESSSQNAGDRETDEYVDRVKALFAAAGDHGEPALTSRLPEQWHPLVSEAAGLIPAIVSAEREWFANDDDQGTPVAQPLAGDPPDHAIGGGVYVRNADLSIRYHPLGHADRYVKQWLDIAVGLADSNPNQQAAIEDMLQIFAEPNASGSRSTRGPVSSGRCLSCHTTRSKPDGTRFIQWSARTPKESMRLLTRFSHRPHIIENEIASCESCHQINDIRVSPIAKELMVQLDQSASKVLQWPHTRHDFYPLSKSSCTACHNRQLNSNGCTTCHDYHASPSDWLEHDQLDELIQSTMATTSVRSSSADP